MAMDPADVNIDELNIGGLPLEVSFHYTEDSKHKYALINRYKHYIRALRQVESQHIADLGLLRDRLAKFEDIRKDKVFKLEKLNQRILDNGMRDTGPLEWRRDEMLTRLKALIGKIEHIKSERAIVIKALKKVIAAKNSIKELYQAFQDGTAPPELVEEEDEDDPPTVIEPEASVTNTN